MQRKKYIFFIGILLTCFFLPGNNKVFSAEINYRPIEIQDLTRYTEDRVAFQQHGYGGTGQSPGGSAERRVASSGAPGGQPDAREGEEPWVG